MMERADSPGQETVYAYAWYDAPCMQLACWCLSMDPSSSANSACGHTARPDRTTERRRGVHACASRWDVCTNCARGGRTCMSLACCLSSALPAAACTHISGVSIVCMHISVFYCTTILLYTYVCNCDSTYMYICVYINYNIEAPIMHAMDWIIFVYAWVWSVVCARPALMHADTYPPGSRVGAAAV